MYTKTIRYDRETRDFAMYLDDQLVGWARSYAEAETTLDKLVYDRLTKGQPAPEPEPEPAPALPEPAAVAEVLAELEKVARAAGDKPNANALNKATYWLARGCEVVADLATGALLIPSSSGGIYRVDDRGCSCEAGAHGSPCWHSALAEGYAVARDIAVAERDNDAGPLPYDGGQWADGEAAAAFGVEAFITPGRAGAMLAGIVAA